MGATLKDFASDSTSTGAPVRVPAKGLRLPKSNFIGVAFLPKNTLPDVGSAATFTPPGGSGTAAPITPSNLVSVLQSLALNGLAIVFGNGAISGKRAPFKADEESVIFGSQRTKRDTGEGEIVYSFMFKYAYHNTAFMNQLRLAFTEYDVYAFTDRSVEVIRQDLNEPTFKNVKNGEVTGSNTDVISNGGFDIIIGSDGDIEPSLGLFERALALSNFRYTFGVPTVTGTGLTATLNGTVINKTSTGTGTIANPVLEVVSAGVVSYAISLEAGQVLPAGITIDSATGIVTVAASVVAGSYKVVVQAENKTGVIGEYNFRLIAA